MIDISVISESENDKPFGVILPFLLLLKFESHLLPQSKLLYAEKERRGFCPTTSKEKKATKKFWISDGSCLVQRNFS